MSKLKKWISQNILFVLLAVITLLFGFLNSGTRYNFIAITSLITIGLLSLCVIFLLNDKKGISLNKTFGVFNFFFFSLAPIVQFKNYSSFYIDRTFSIEMYLNLALLLNVVLVLYILMYSWFFYSFSKNEIKKNEEIKMVKVNPYTLFLLSVLAFFSYLFLIKFDFSLLFIRPPMFYLKHNTNFGFLGYAILLVVKLIPFIVLVYYKLLNPRNDKFTLLLLAVVILVFLPTASERVYTGLVYLPLFLLFIPKLKEGYNFIVLFFFGLLIVFPVLNNFRYGFVNDIDWTYEMFNTGHFDAFQNFMILLDEQIITYGRQLLGSVLFFVQENTWPGRPVGSGHLLGEHVGYEFLNVAMPFFGEGYVNFGLIGVLLFVIIAAVFNSFFDVLDKNNPLNIFFTIGFYILIAFELYILRGDLMSSIKISTSIILAVTIVYFYIKLLISLKSSKIEKRG
jgi:hypothetical protein